MRYLRSHKEELKGRGQTGGFTGVAGVRLGPGTGGSGCLAAASQHRAGHLWQALRRAVFFIAHQLSKVSLQGG